MNENTRPLTCIGDAEDSNYESQLNFLLGKDIELDKGCENFLLALLKRLTTTLLRRGFLALLVFFRWPNYTSGRKMGRKRAGRLRNEI